MLEFVHTSTRSTAEFFFHLQMFLFIGDVQTNFIIMTSDDIDDRRGRNILFLFQRKASEVIFYIPSICYSAKVSLGYLYPWFYDGQLYARSVKLSNTFSKDFMELDHKEFDQHMF